MVAKNVSKLKHPAMLILVSLFVGSVANDAFLDNEFHSLFETNKINKGISMWKRHRHREEQGETGHFFRSNSVENEPNLPFIQALPVRHKRAASSKVATRHTKSANGLMKSNEKRSLFNDYPLGVTMLLENSNNKHIDYNAYSKPATKPMFKIANDKKVPEKEASKEDDNLHYILKEILNITDGNATSKRSMKYDSLVIDRIDLLGVSNKSKDVNKTPTANGDQRWPTTPVHDKNVYEMLPHEPTTEKASPLKPISEKGLIKVLSVLTKTLKKVMKQHHTIKVIHNEMNNSNKEIQTKLEQTSNKLNEFEVKHVTISKLFEKLNSFNECLKNKEEMLKKKEDAMSKNLLEFENQQNKFLAQQQQFYNIQRMMLMQNEKVNEKQNAIAKMQSEIAHRQNQFAKVLNKIKQTDHNKNHPKNNLDLVDTKVPEINRTTIPPTTQRLASIEPVKINLMSLPSNNIIEDHDQMILREKDDKSVDDLIYKYYFNNTFIDTIIKNKILGGIHVGDKTSLARSAKMAAKRNHVAFVKNATKTKTTILFPIGSNSVKRARRWINHHSTRKHKKRHHSKGHPVFQDSQKHESIFKSNTELPRVTEAEQKDPFLAMATNFCKEIGQTSTKQILDWCVEKAIRRLSSLDKKLMMPAVPVIPEMTTAPVTTTTTTTPVPVVTTTHVTKERTSTPRMKPPVPLFSNGVQTPLKVPGPYENQFFPDNQELEEKLKDFDLTPDTAGNVYFDGSLHASDILGENQSEGLSDVLPGYDSNSKIELDPRVIEMQLRKKGLKAKLPHKLWKN